MKYSWLFICLLLCPHNLRGEFAIARNGQARCAIVEQAGASEPERSAFRELTNMLQQITGVQFKGSSSDLKSGEKAIIVGPGPLAAKYFPGMDLAKLGSEEFVMQVKGGKLLLAGGRPRGTVYAVNRFLQQQCGARWWTPWATNVPRQASLQVADLNMRAKPAFEYRGAYWFPGFEPHWKAHNCVNNETWEIPKELGGCITYKGFCHTFYPLVPPEKHFAEHPEWYSLIKGQRTHEGAQLCLTNPRLRDFVVGRVKEWLRESPDAQIISVTQNDCQGWCECPDCKALDDAEGSHAGTMLAFANYIAEKIEPEFPNVAVDTFAYQYTRHPPKTIRPRENVIVRLCSIECNFREPLDEASNADFLADLKGWSRICPRLFVWDYTTDFKNYVHPHPNWFTLGPNARLLQKFGAKGLFEQGAYAGQGAEMAELRAWLLAQLLFDPQQDDRGLIKEFLSGYYGKEAARPIYRYLELMHQASKGVFLGCYLRKEQAPYLRFPTLAAAERLWQKAETAAELNGLHGEQTTRGKFVRPAQIFTNSSTEAQGIEKAAAEEPDQVLRVRIAHLPVRCALLKNWVRLRRQCWEQNETWPLPESRKAVADAFREVCRGVPGKDWTQVRVMSEHGLVVEDFLKEFVEDPPDKNGPPPPVRISNPLPPSDIGRIDARNCIDLQDNLAALYLPGKFADIKPDSRASDLRAVWMPGDHAEWAFRVEGTKLPAKAQSGKWKVYAVVRIKREGECDPNAIVFAAGVYDNSQKTHVAGLQVKAADAGDSYRSYLLGTAELSASRDIWVSPANNKCVKAVWVDRVFLAPAPN